MPGWLIFNPRMGICAWSPSASFPAASTANLAKSSAEFLDESGTRPEAACFGIAGPVRNGRVETSNLPWVIEQSRLAKQIHLPATLLINDLEASAWGIGALAPADLVPLNQVSGPAVGNQAVIAPGTGLGEAGLFWDGTRHHVFACEGGHTDFAPQGELQIELLRFLERAFRTRELRAHSLRSRPGERLRISARQRMRKGISGACCRHGDRAIRRRQFRGRRWTDSCPLAGKALDLWIAVYGAEASNLALKVMATGGLVPGGRHLSEDSSQADWPRVHEGVSRQGPPAPAGGSHAGARRHQREGRTAGSGALRGGSRRQRLSVPRARCE